MMIIGGLEIQMSVLLIMRLSETFIITFLLMLERNIL